jgi:hypothetical protein
MVNNSKTNMRLEVLLLTLIKIKKFSKSAKLTINFRLILISVLNFSKIRKTLLHQAMIYFCKALATNKNNFPQKPLKTKILSFCKALKVKHRTMER